MKNLRFIPYIHRHQPIVKAAFAFDKVIAYYQITLGKNLKPIEKLLRKSSSETIAVCRYISKKSLANIKSPLDWIIDNQNTDTKSVT